MKVELKSVGLREVGVVIILVAVFMVFLLVWFVDTLSSASQQSCGCGELECTMNRFEVPTLVYVGLFGVCLMFFIGISLIVKKGELYARADVDRGWSEKLKKLEGDDKTLYNLLMNAGGTLFQSEITEKMEWSKVKVTRTLDKLESRRLLERRRRGLTNIIVLK